MRIVHVVIFTIVMLTIKTSYAQELIPNFNLPSPDSIEIIADVLKQHDFKDRDRGDITGCVLGIVSDLENTLSEVKITEPMVTHYAVLCIVLDIKMKDKQLKRLKESTTESPDISSDDSTPITEG